MKTPLNALQRFAGDADDIEPMTLKRIVKRVWVGLPEEVATIYRAAAALSVKYPNRPFTPDGHLVGSIGEVVAAEALGLRPRFERSVKLT